MSRAARLALLAALLATPLPAPAQVVSEAPEEARVRELARTLRCPVCQSESILESRAGTAQEMMVLLREMVAAGQGDTEIAEFFRTRYGDFVMLAPPREGAGRIIWALPLILVLLGAGVFAAGLRRRGPARPPADTVTGKPLDAARLREMEP